jgi:hypothetical protein
MDIEVKTLQESLDTLIEEYINHAPPDAVILRSDRLYTGKEEC